MNSLPKYFTMIKEKNQKSRFREWCISKSIEKGQQNKGSSQEQLRVLFNISKWSATV